MRDLVAQAWAKDVARPLLAGGTATLCVALASAFVLAWLVFHGGAVSGAQRSAAARALEECDLTLVSTPVAARALAPELAAHFLLRYGYVVERAARRADGTGEIVGVRGGRRCTVRVRPGGADRALRALAVGEADIVLAARRISAGEIRALEAAGAGALAPVRQDAERLVGVEVLALAVHPSNPVAEISFGAARALSAGEIARWSEIGGPDAPVLVQIDQESLAQIAPRETVPEEPSPAPRFTPHATQRDVVNAIAATPHAVGLLSALLLEGAGVRALEIGLAGARAAPTRENVARQAYPFSRPLFAYARPADARADALTRSFLAFLAEPAALDRIDAAGFVAPGPGRTLQAASLALSTSCAFGVAESAALAKRLEGADRLPNAVMFSSATTALSPDQQAQVARLAAVLRGRLSEGAGVILVGHSDDVGEARRNRALGLERANALRAALEDAGVLGVEVESAGEMCPLDDNATDTGRNANRRVEIWVRPA